MCVTAIQEVTLIWVMKLTGRNWANRLDSIYLGAKIPHGRIQTSRGKTEEPGDDHVIR